MRNKIAPITGSSWVMLPILGVIILMGFFGAFFAVNLVQEIGASSCTQSVSGLTTVEGRLTICQGGTEGQVLGKLSNGLIGWTEDVTASVTGAGVVALDLTDDDSNESSALSEIATSGCTGSAFAQDFTEPSADKLLIGCNQPDFTDLSGTASDDQIPDNVTIDLAATATAAAANGTNCLAGSAAGGTDTSWNSEDCTDYEEDLSDSAGLAAALSDETGSGLAVFATGPTLAGTVAVTGAGSSFAVALDCTQNANGGALTTTALGVLTCSDDDSGASSGYDTVEDEDVAVTQRDTLNFVGAGVTCADDTTKTTCTIAGGSSQNVFDTVIPTAGENIVADNATDDITLTSVTATVTVTGTAASDTLDFSVTPDSITTDYLSDGADVPSTGECLLVAADPLDVEYDTCPGGGSQNLFETFTPPLGDPIVADSTTDTFNFDSPNFTVALTGTAASDTLSVDVLDSPRIAGTLVGNTATDDTVMVGSGVANGVWVGLPDCDGADDAYNYDVDTNTFSCRTFSYISNGFATVDVPGGTDPTASGEGTLTFTSTGATVAITGTGSNTINFEAEDVNCTACLGTTEIAGLDISDDTNLAAGRSLTLSGDSVEADAELYAWEKTINMTVPLTGSNSNLAQFSMAVASTVTRVACSTSSGSVTIQFDERAESTPNTAGTDVLTSNLVCDTDSEITTSFDNATFAQYAPINLQIITGSGAPEVVRIHLWGTRDD